MKGIDVIEVNYPLVLKSISDYHNVYTMRSLQMD